MNQHSRIRINLIFGCVIIILVLIGIFTSYEGSLIGLSSPDSIKTAMRVVKYEMLSNIFEILAVVLAMYLLNRAFDRAKAAEDEKSKFVSLVQQSSDLIAMSNKERVLSYINPAGKRMLGVVHDSQIYGQPATQLYDKENNSVITDEVIPALRTAGTWHGEVSFKNIATGELVPMSMNTFVIRDPETNEILGNATVSKDLREQKKLERQFDRFFEVPLEIFVITDGNTGHFLKVTPTICQVLGYTKEELYSRPCMDFIHPDDIEPTIKEIERQMKGESVWRFENRYRTKSGDYRWFSWKAFPDGHLSFGSARDVTEEKKQNEMIEKLSQNAVAASKAKSEFLANMSHEIRTPINGVIGMTSLLLDTELAPAQLEFTENIKSSAGSLLTIINDILDFSKIEAGKLDIEVVDFSLDSLVHETTKNMSWLLKNKSLPLIVECEADSTRLYKGDPGRIRQILTNLLSNAVKFTTKGSIRLEVTATRHLEHATEFRFAVKDTGMGISESGQKKLFQAFSQADNSTTRKYGGTGLGLSISHRLVKLMNGEIGVESTEGQGSTFWFTLLLENSKAQLPEKKPASTIVKTKYPGSQILVAEDNVINQKILVAMLQKLGFSPQAVADGSEVISLLHDRSFDLILMDCQMPVLDGYEATQKIRASTSINNVQIPVIAMTANALKGDREKCLASGMNDYASKPINIAELSILIEKWLDSADGKSTT